MSYWLHEEAERELEDVAVFYAEHATPKYDYNFRPQAYAVAHQSREPAYWQGRQ